MSTTAPLTRMQTRMLVMSVGDSYRVPIVFPLQQGLDEAAALVQTRALPDRFATLRSRPRHDATGFALEVGTVRAPEVAAVTGDATALLRSGTLRTTPDTPFRAAVVRDDAGRLHVAAEMHHIAVDGPSLLIVADHLAGGETPATTEDDVVLAQERVVGWELEQTTARESDEPLHDPSVDGRGIGTLRRATAELQPSDAADGARGARVSARAFVQGAVEIAAETVLDGSAYAVTQSWRWSLGIDHYVGSTPVLVERRIGTGALADRAMAVFRASADPRVLAGDRVVEAPSFVYSYEAFGEARYVEVDSVPKSALHVRYVDLGSRARIVCEWDDRRTTESTVTALVSAIQRVIGAHRMGEQ